MYIYIFFYENVIIIIQHIYIAYMYVCNICIYIHTCIHTHTHTYTHSQIYISV